MADRAELPRPEHLCLEDLITTLEIVHPARVVPIGFHNPHSYRGDYVDLAFELKANVSVAEMLASAREALGTTYQGWKGGDYTMSDYTLVWLVTERGDCGESLGAMLLHFLLDAPLPDEKAEREPHG